MKIPEQYVLLRRPLVVVRHWYIWRLWQNKIQELLQIHRVIEEEIIVSLD